MVAASVRRCFATAGLYLADKSQQAGGDMAGSSDGLRVGFIGYGTAARQVETGIRLGEAGNAHLAAVLVRRPPVDPPDVFVTTDRKAFLEQPLDVVVELAGQDAVRQ